jgi:hypothetical protein
MTGGRRKSLVEARADLILSGKPTAEAYAAHFEAQMRRGMVRKVLCTRRLARAGAFVIRLCQLGAGDPPDGPAA